jgi:hypothetical protein
LSGWFSVPATPAPASKYEWTQAAIKELLDRHDRFIISSVQVNTKVHKNFWASLKQYAFHNNAAILLRPVYYMWKQNKADRWFDGDCMEYICENELQLHEGLTLMDVQVSATAVNPLTALEGLTGKRSAIVGHPQIQMKTVATPQSNMPKIMVTTGSISEKNNYSPTKAGKKGAFHHSLGAVVVEKDGEIFHIRNVTGDNKGEFYDLGHKYTPNGMEKVDRIEAIVTGDEHQWWISEDVAKATYFDDDSIVKILNPKKIVRHDVSDSFSISHHHQKNTLLRYMKYRNHDDNLAEEMADAAVFINETTPPDTENVIIASNHHDHVMRWLNEVDWRYDMANAQIYHHMWSALLNAANQNVKLDPFVWWMQGAVTVPTQWLTRKDKVMICGIMVNMHGDAGPNGARGSISNLKNIGVKSIIAHSHTPGIDKGCYQVGTSTGFELSYTRGPSSWMNTHALIHPNGKRQLVHIIRNKWRK